MMLNSLRILQNIILVVFENNCKDSSHIISYFAGLTISLIFVVQLFDSSHSTCLEEQSVKASGTRSSDAPRRFCVRQGSVLGSLLFTLYSNDVKDIIEAHVLLPYNYGDDCKIFFYCRAQDDNQLQHVITKYIENVPR